MFMKVVAVISTKGGSGKSVLACALAVTAAEEGQTYLCDTDPQASSASWWKRRGGPDNPMLVRERSSVRLSTALRAIRQKGEERDWLIADTPGSFMDLVEDAVMKADVIVLVMQPAFRDIEAQAPAFELISAYGKAEQTVIVLNRCDPRSKAPETARQKLQLFTGNQIHTLANRAVYAKADGYGDAPQELDERAEDEIVSLWQAVKEVGSRSTRKPQSHRGQRARQGEP
jgi:chromosome partitioning protein